MKLFAIVKNGITFTSTNNNNMKNIAKSLENKTILILNAVTLVNSGSKKSRIVNQKISLGPIVYERNDGVFFEPLEFEGNEWRAFYRFENDKIEIDQLKNSKSKTIIIKEFTIVE